MNNPWLQLPPLPPYVLPDDAAEIERFNLRCKVQHAVHLDIFPEPYLGKTDAPVVLLNLNPGFNPNDLMQHQNPAFARRSRENLCHSPSKYPFYLLDPELIDRTRWWEKKLKPLIEKFGTLTVANKVLCVEFFPYHSKRFGHSKIRLPSQQYSFWLVTQAILRHAVILIMRSERRWLEEVPELASFPNRFTASSVQNPIISENNFANGFESAVNAIENTLKAGHTLR